MIDPAFIGYEFGLHHREVEKGQLRFFARAIAETNPIYSDEAAARAAGYPSLPVPPTFLFCLDMDRDNQYDYMDTMGIELGKVLHGEQNFRYYGMTFAGDTLSFASRITDIYAKKAGSLEFVVRDTSVHRGNDRIADLRSTIIIRHR
jgi:acyl dehydratase